MRAPRRSTSVDQHFSKSLLCASRTVSEEGGGLNELDVAVLAISAVDIEDPEKYFTSRTNSCPQPNIGSWMVRCPVICLPKKIFRHS